MYSDNPLNDYNAYEAERNRKQEEHTVYCEICGEYISDDHYYDINGTVMCEDCLNREYRVEVD